MSISTVIVALNAQLLRRTARPATARAGVSVCTRAGNC